MVKFSVNGTSFNSIDELSQQHILDQLDLSLLEVAASTVDDGVDGIRVPLACGVKVVVTEA